METLAINRTCKACGEKLLGRSDKHCCDDQCRATYNRRLKDKASRLNPEGVAAIQRTIITNYKIMSQLIGIGDSLVQKGTMISMGFHFNYMTHLLDHKGSTFICCFDKGYMMIGEEVLIMNISSLGN